MFGEPSDIDGQCNARLFIGDNYGDGTATMRCQLAIGHEGMHREDFKRKGGPVTVTWTADERRKCDHGCGQWNHDHSETIACPKDAEDHEWSDCAYCHPGEPAVTCEKCGRAYYYADEHRQHCMCDHCGQYGGGRHACPGVIAAFVASGAEEIP